MKANEHDAALLAADGDEVDDLGAKARGLDAERVRTGVERQRRLERGRGRPVDRDRADDRAPVGIEDAHHDARQIARHLRAPRPAVAANDLRARVGSAGGEAIGGLAEAPDGAERLRRLRRFHAARDLVRRA